MQVSVYGQDNTWAEFTSDMAVASCAFFAQEYLTGPQDYGGKFFVSEHHQEWDELIHKHDRLCVLAPRDHGKCQTGDAKILAGDGQLVRLDEWKGES